MIKPILFELGVLKLLDQRVLPAEEEFVEVKTLEDGYHAIKDMVVRGAPSIGFSAIYTMALTVKSYNDINLEKLKKDCDYLISSRPTAVNLKFEVQKCESYIKSLISEGHSKETIYQKLVELGHNELKLSHERNLQMAKYAASELTKISNGPYRLQTHCNTGFLACGSLGTALGVVSYLNSIGKVQHVYVDETRPYLQGSRLSSYELIKEKISHEIVADSACSYLMKNNMVDAIFVGADRIALNGDTANKIGTSTLAIVAKNYNIPFYVVAPLSSFDPKSVSGDDIEIELRPEEEITQYKKILIAHKEARALNPSFDVTSCEHITGIICEKGVLTYPFDEKIRNIFES